MSIAYNPASVMDGLVLYLDAANPKSYPNYNMATYSQDFGNAVYSKSLVITTTGLLAPDGTLTATTLTDNSNTVWQAFSRSFTVNNNSDSYNISIYIKKTTGGTSARTGFNVGFAGGTAVNINPRFNADTGVLVGASNMVVTSETNDFWRFSFTVANNSTGNTTLNISYYPATGFYNGSDDATATGSHTVWGLQVTRGTALLPYNAITTQSLNDWFDISGTGNNMTLVNGPTFGLANGGNMVFDGVNDYVSSATMSNPSGQLTCEIVMRYSAKSTYHNIFDRSSTNPMFWIRPSTQSNAIELNAGNLISDVGYANQTIVATTIYRSDVSPGLQLYVNGDLVKTTNALQSVWPNPFTITLFNRNLSETYQGTVYSMKFYNRALTESEIKQNFNAIRGRYGI